MPTSDRAVLVDLLLEAVHLKSVQRAGWVRKGIPAPESVADHSWGVGWLVLALLPPDLNRERALAYAVLHDLAEVRVGDLTPFDGVDHEEKIRREHAALADLLADLPAGEQLLETWALYVDQADPEARFVRQLDRLDMAITAVAYATAGHPGLAEFIDSADQAITHPDLRSLIADLRTRLPQP